MSVRSYLQSRNFNVDSVVDFQTLPVTDLNGVVVTTTNFSTSIGGNGHKYEYDSSQAKSGHDGYTIISPTVPWDGTAPTLAAFQAGTGETDGAGTGCWVLRDTVREVSGRVRFEGPEIQEDVVTDAQKGVANGVASLDGTGKVPASQLGGGISLLDTITPTATTTIDMSNVIAANPGYDYYRFKLKDIEWSGGSDRLGVRVSIDGSTARSTAGDYQWALQELHPSFAPAGARSTSDSGIRTMETTGLASSFIDGFIDVYTPSSTSRTSPIIARISNTPSGASCDTSWVTATFDATTDDITGLILYLYDGTATAFAASGVVEVYGSNVPF